MIVLRLVLYISIALGFLSTSPPDFAVVLHGLWKLPIFAGRRDHEGFGLLQGGDTKYAEWPQGQRPWLLVLTGPLLSTWPWASIFLPWGLILTSCINRGGGRGHLNEVPVYQGWIFN